MTSYNTPQTSSALLEEAYQIALSRYNREKYAEAMVICQEIMGLSPSHLPTLNLLGLMALHHQKYQLAETFFHNILEVDESLIEAWVNLSSVHKQANNKEKAKWALEQALQRDSKHIGALNNLATLHLHSGDLHHAESLLQLLLKQDPKNVDGNYNMAILQESGGKYHKAIDYYKTVLHLQPEHHASFMNLGNAQLAIGDHKAAMESYSELCNRKPTDPAPRSNLLVTRNYLTGTDEKSLNQDHISFGLLFNTERKTRRSVKKKPPFRVGYFSPDFRSHPIYFFILPLLSHHRRSNVQVICYSDVLRPDNKTAECKGFADTWRDISTMPDHEVYTLIQQDEIDLLIDLSGHTARNRLPLFAQKPAPLQATYLGYPNTTGIPGIDYYITDETVSPSSLSCYSEEICRLEGPFFTYSPPEEAPALTSLPALKNGYITFGVFHNLAKVDDGAMTLWCQLLKDIPDSRLLWQAKAFAETQTREKILTRFNTHGIATERISLHEGTNLEQHLMLHNSIDISLDTSPWTGHTTTCHSLWMGVPIITLAGQTERSRLGMTTLEHAGLPELIATNREEYLEKNLGLARDFPRLEHYRNIMRNTLMASKIMAHAEFTEGLEKEYLQWLLQ